MTFIVYIQNKYMIEESVLTCRVRQKTFAPGSSVTYLVEVFLQDLSKIIRLADPL
jgi:hypothetical protein